MRRSPAPPPRTVIRVRDPRAAVAQAITKLHPRMEPQPGTHPTAILGPGTVAATGCSIGPYAVLGAGVRVGAGTVIGAGAVIGDHVHIGASTARSRPTSRFYHEVTLGRRVVLHAGGRRSGPTASATYSWTAGVPQLPADWTRGDRRRGGDWCQLVCRSRSAGCDGDWRRTPSSTIWCTSGTTAASDGTW